MRAGLQSLARAGLRAWGRWGKAPGWHYQAVERWGASLAGDRLADTRLPNGCVIGCDLTDHVQRLAYFAGAYEPIECWVLLQLLRLGMTFVDAGANFGQYTLLASTAVGASGAVHSFEPVPRSFAQLERNVARNRLANVRLNPVALWDRAERLRLGLGSDMRGNAGSFSVGVTGGIDEAFSAAVRFDDYAEEQRLARVDVVKMDIEGAERAALRGMMATLRRDRPILLVEVNRVACERLGYPPSELWTLLAGELGYRGWRIGGSAAECRAIGGLDGVEQSNVLFHHDELPASVRSGWDLKSVMRWATRAQTRAAR